ncbi:hypothetical protein ES703_29024 [subsurface metagenome]
MSNGSPEKKTESQKPKYPISTLADVFADIRRIADLLEILKEIHPKGLALLLEALTDSLITLKKVHPDASEHQLKILNDLIAEEIEPKISYIGEQINSLNETIKKLLETLEGSNTT